MDLTILIENVTTALTTLLENLDPWALLVLFFAWWRMG